MNDLARSPVRSSARVRIEDAMQAILTSLAVMVSASVALAGCASTEGTTDHPMTRGADTERMAKVETAARRANVEVHWINYPQKPQP